jgi:hypothetical protein
VDLQTEVDFEGGSNGHGHAVFHGRFETVSLSALDGFLVKAGIEGSGLL